MGKKSGPPPPDYTDLAEKTAQSANDQLLNQTWANRPSQVDAFGNRVDWKSSSSTDPVTGKPVVDSQGNAIPQWTQQTTLSPELQQAYKTQLAMQQGRTDIANSLMPQIASAYGKQIDFNNFTPLAGVPKATNSQATTSATGGLPGLQNIDTSRQGTPQLKTALDFSGLQSVDNADATRSKAFENLMNQANSRLDPQWQQQQTQLASQLANKGITEGSAAYQQAMDQFSRSKTDAYNQALMSAQSGAGQQAQIDYGMNMGLRQQGMQEVLQKAGFSNDALSQMFGMGNTARQSQLGAQQAAFGQDLQRGQFGLTKEQQAFAQRMGANAQNYQQAMQGAGYQNQLRQQQIGEANQQQSWALNALNALLSGQQVGAPQFGQFSQAGMGQGVDFSGAGDKQFQAGMQQQQMANQAMSNMISGVTSIGSMAMMSDARLKTHIRTVGRDPRGWRIVSFRFVGSRVPHVGVIAQEVHRMRPDVVAANAAGYLTVDLGRLYA